MPYFIYKAKDQSGQLIDGTLEAENRSAVAARLQTMGYFPLTIGAKEEPSDKGLQGVLKRLSISGTSIKGRDLTMFYRQMSDLVGAGVPLVKALGIVKTQCINNDLKTLLSKVDQDVQGGDTFAQALARHPNIFNKLSTAMIKAGETGGLLEETLSRLANFAEADEELKGRVKSALAYPVIMTLAGGLAIAILVTFVIPKIVGLFDELNQELPFITQLLMGITGFLRSYWLFLLGGAGVGIVSLLRYVKSDAGGMRFDRFVLQIPVVSEIVLKRQVAGFSRTLGSLLKNGVPILTAIDISKEVLSNRVILSDIERVPEGIAKGGGMANTLRESEFFPPVVINMIAIGEETGNLPDILLKVAGTFEAQVDRSMKTLTSLLEPIIILVMGLVVGFIVIAMLLPIFELDPTRG